MDKPTRNIERTINIISIDQEKQRLMVYFNNNSDTPISFVNGQRIQFLSDDKSIIYNGKYRKINDDDYIENITSSDLNYDFSGITTSTVFKTYDYSYFWLPNQENYLTLKMVYDFFKNSASKSNTSISTNSIVTSDDENSMCGFVTPFDKWRIDSSKTYIKSLNGGSSLVFYFDSELLKDLDIFVISSNNSCHINLNYIGDDNLSVIMKHNGFDSFNINANKLSKENDKTLIKFIIDCENEFYISATNNFDVFVFNVDESDYTSNVILFNGDTEIFEVLPKMFKVDKNRVLSFEDSSNGAIELQDGYDLKDITKNGEYYSVNGSTIINAPENLNGSFTLLCYSNGRNNRPIRYNLFNEGDEYLGKYNNGTIVWKKVLNELPKHDHNASEIITDVNNQFVSLEDIQRWNNASDGLGGWTIKEEIIPVDVNFWNINQTTLVKNLLYVSNDLELLIKNNGIGIQGLTIIKNISEQSIDITTNINSGVVMLGVDTNISNNDNIVTVPANKALEIYYMKLNDNLAMCKFRLLNIITNNLIDYRVVGEEANILIR